MKRIMSLMLACAMLATIVGCGNEPIAARKTPVQPTKVRVGWIFLNPFMDDSNEWFI